MTTRAFVSRKIEKGHHTRYVVGHSPLIRREKPWFHPGTGRWWITRRGKKMYRYRAMMEDHLERKLGRHELVHHVNGDPTDDRLENLEIVNAKEHRERHPEVPNPPPRYR